MDTKVFAQFSNRHATATMQQESGASRMNLLEAAIQKDKDESARIIKEPTSWQGQFQPGHQGSPTEQNKGGRVSFEETKLAAKRPASSTVKPAPKRRTYRKDTIIAMLRSDNDSLRTQLEASKEENRRLRELMVTENETALNRNRALQNLLQQHLCQQQQSRVPQRGLMDQTSLSSSQRGRSTGDMSNDDMLLALLLAKKREQQRPSGDTGRRLDQPFQPNRGTCTEQSVSSSVRPPREASNLSYDAAVSTRSGMGNIQGTNGGVSVQGSSVSNGTIQTELQLQRLQEELEALQRRLGSIGGR